MSEGYEDLLAMVRRDINCLADESRVTRRRSLDKLKRKCLALIEDELDASRDLLRELFCGPLHEPLLKCMADPIEKHREITVTLLKEIVEALAKLPSQVGNLNFLDLIVPHISSRLGQSKTIEPSEELRLETCSLLKSLMNLYASQAVKRLGDIAIIICNCCADNFPELKREACSCIKLLSSAMIQVWDELALDTRDATVKSLVAALLPNLKHQHSKTRLRTLEAISSLATCAPELPVCLVESLPQIANIQHDRTPSVRMALPKEIQRWIRPGDEPSVQAQLLLIMLAGVSDESPDVVAACLKTLGALGGQQTEEKKDDSRNDWLPANVAKPLSVRPTAGARAFLMKSMQQLISMTLVDLADWTVNTRRAAAGLLHLLLVHAEEDSISLLEKVMASLIKAVSDGEAPIREIVFNCVRVLGFFTPPSTHLPLILTNIERNIDPGYRRSCLVVLECLLDGTPDNVGVDLKSVELILKTLTSDGVQSSEHAAVRHHLTRVTSLLINRAPKLCAEAATNLRIFMLLLHIDTSSQSPLLQGSSNADLQKEAQEILSVLTSLMQCLDGSSVVSHPGDDHAASPLYRLHFREALKHILGGGKLDWSKDSHKAELMFTLLRRAGSVAADHFDSVLPVLAYCASSEVDVELRVGSLQFLCQILLSSSSSSPNSSSVSSSSLSTSPASSSSNSSLASLEPESIAFMMIHILIPCCVWRTGRISASLRLQAFVCLHAVFARSLVSKETLENTSEHLFPVLKSCLDDDNPTVRLQIVKIWGYVFTLFNKPLDPPHFIEVTDLHRALIDRMDDNDDRVRLDVPITMNLFIKHCFPPYAEYDVNDQHFAYIVKSFLVHVDDANPQIREACFDFLQKIQNYNSSTYVTELGKARGKHSDPSYVERLLAQAESAK